VVRIIDIRHGAQQTVSATMFALSAKRSALGLSACGIALTEQRVAHASRVASLTYLVVKWSHAKKENCL
jgi:hypothetical protein